VLKAAREFAAKEFAGHRYLMVLHDHQANPHVHLSVRATARDGSRLNPRKTDLHRWRETFAEKLRGWGVEAEASRQSTRGENRRFDELWRVKARSEGRLSNDSRPAKSGGRHMASRAGALQAWANITKALQSSEHPEDRALARDIEGFVRGSAWLRDWARSRGRQITGLEQSTTVSRGEAPRSERDVDIRR